MLKKNKPKNREGNKWPCGKHGVRKMVTKHPVWEKTTHCNTNSAMDWSTTLHLSWTRQCLLLPICVFTFALARAMPALHHSDEFVCLYAGKMIRRHTLFYLSVLPVKWRVSFLKCIRRTPSFLHVTRSFLVLCPPCFSVRQSESLGRVTDRRLWDPWKRRRIFDGSKRPCSRMGRKAEMCCTDCFFSLSR